MGSLNLRLLSLLSYPRGFFGVKRIARRFSDLIIHAICKRTELSFMQNFAHNLRGNLFLRQEVVLE